MERRLSEPRPEFLALGFLMRGPVHGYQLYQAFSEELGMVWHMSQSQLYATLKRLAAKGWIVADNEKVGRQTYCISPEGKTRFLHWLLSASVSSARIIRLEFISRLFFADYLKVCSPLELIESQLGVVRSEVERFKCILADTAKSQFFSSLSLDFRVSQLSALDSWLSSLRQYWTR